MAFEIIIGIILGIVIYLSLIKPWLIQTCLINSKKCIKINYKQKDNSLLIHIVPTGKTIWFDGKDILIYNEPTGKICENNSQPVYVWDTKINKEKGYLCAKTLKEVNLFYKNYPTQYISIKTDKTLNMFDIINHFIDLGIISV